MKAISLWQPWASLIVIGSKRIETRHWPTNVRGRILIHAAKKKDIQDLTWLFSHGEYDTAIGPLLRLKKTTSLFDVLPFGAIVGSVDLVDCLRVEEIPPNELDFRRYEHPEHDYKYWTERTLGNYESGRFGWMLRNPRVWDMPMPYRGSQGFFEVDDELARQRDWHAGVTSAP